MSARNIITQLRTMKGLSQGELAEQVFVTHQAVSRWENGETTPNPETLKLLSKLFNVSINTLLGSPRKMTCHCCGMQLDDSTASREPDGLYNEDYCRWCYADGEFTLDFWKQAIKSGGKASFKTIKEQLISEFNALDIDDLPRVEDLNVLSGAMINLEYALPNGEKARFLNNRRTYLGNQLASLSDNSRCFGIAASTQFLLVCSYEADGANPELILYKKR